MLKIIFAGATQFSAYLLIKLIKKKYKVYTLLTNEDKKRNRTQKICYTQIKKIALLYNIETHQPKKLDNLYTKRLKKKNKIIIVASYGKLFPKNLLELPTHNCYNVHPSLLPKHRGPTPIQEVILNKEKKTVITIFKMNVDFDKGPIIHKKEIKIEENDDSLTLEKKLVKLSFFSVQKVIQKIKKNKIKTIPQNDNKEFKKTKKFKKNNHYINWEQPAENIINQIKAYQINSIPYTILNNKKINIYNVIITQKLSKKKPGTINIVNNKIFVNTITNLIEINKLQIESKKKIKAEQLLNTNNKIIYNNALFS